eukprot:CAMPEP_0201523318 /NCGR_PEP_ID=MMETSP0161_2-20130828/19416_1 /ASSEMBLY_ACC=CAM_ASM_000251 /TAXON_ID=180227 /ORGANISM="Neoparamoeba aestuarina, Strain SoJaBio B1-5/56/2" /LENGTH=537 /DNA_ID=CAMNT_0047922409 /DNA_START=28 /DNA_END=1641 /DNA_ORIENTATION=-
MVFEEIVDKLWVGLQLENLPYGLALLVVVYFVKFTFERVYDEIRFRKITRVPSPVPVFGHLFSILTSGAVWDLFADWCLKYDLTLRFPMWNETVILTADMDFVKRMMVHEFNSYGKHMPTYAPFQPLLGNGLVTSHGALWKKQRKIIGIGFVGDVLDIALECGYAAVERLCDTIEQNRKTNTPIELDEAFRHLAIQVIGQAILSMDPAESDKIFPDLYLPIVEESNRQTWWGFREYLPLPGVLKARSCLKELNKYVIEIIQKRAHERSLNNYEPTKGDILDRILDGCELSHSNPLSMEQTLQLLDEVKTFLLAGHETTASTLIWSIFELLRHPEALARVRKEAAELFAKMDSKNSNEFDIDKHLFKKGLPFTEAVIRESLRLYSVVPMVTRTPVIDDEFKGQKIPKGTWISIMIRAIHLRPDLWENPTEWNPERFITFDSIAMKNFMAFTQGPRRCMGQFFSITESKIVLARLLHRLDLTIVGKGGDVSDLLVMGKGREKEREKEKERVTNVERHPYVVPVCPREPVMVMGEKRNKI